MSKLGKKLIKAAKEGVAIVRSDMVGKYFADYSPPTNKELARPTGAEELFSNSREK